MIEARSLRKIYHDGTVSLEVLKGVSLTIPDGEFLAITGPSGAGKSTLLHLLAGLDAPTQGEVVWDGQALSSMSEGERARLRNQRIGFVFQFYHLLPELSALENVMLPGLVNGRRRLSSAEPSEGRVPAHSAFRGCLDRSRSRVPRAKLKGDLRARALARLEQVGLEDRARHKPSQLSGGELQRVAIARALINEPTVVLCDEPTGNLDSHTGAVVAELLIGAHRQQRMTLVLVTHEQALAKLADRWLVLTDGHIVADAVKPVAPVGPLASSTGSTGSTG